MEGITVGYAMCGSFCTMSQATEELEKLTKQNINVIPIMSDIVYNNDTRFTKKEELKQLVKQLTGNDIIHTVIQAEPIGPKKMLDILIVSPCTGNTLSKIANGITDSSVTMAVKAHLRNNRPVVLAIATNDALSASAKNIGVLLNTKNIYFVPFSQDDAIKKPTSIIADFTKIQETVAQALKGNQIKPLIL